MKSIWEKEDIKVKEYKEKEKWDIIVIGGGMAGILCAYTLQKEGFSVLVLEANKIMQGQSGKTTAKITSQHGLKYAKLIKNIGIEKTKKYIQANEEAILLFEKIIQEEKIDCDFSYCDSYLYSLEKNRLEEEIEAIKKLGILAYVSDESELPFPIGEAIVFKKQAQFHPIKFVKAIVKDLFVLEECRVFKIKKNTIISTKGVFKADKIILCTHFPIKNIPGFYFFRMHQEKSYVVAIKNVPILLNQYKDINPKGLSFRGYEDFILLTGEAHRCGKENKNAYVKLIQKAKEFYPNGTIETMWSAQDCMPHDEIPFIGRYSLLLKDVYLASGFGKWGMTSSMLASCIIKDLILEKENKYTSLFSAQRLSIYAYKNFLIDVKESGMGLIQGLLCKNKCMHLGCKLQYNENDESYDCPCHGSCYKMNGIILNAPTVNVLKNKKKK